MEGREGIACSKQTCRLYACPTRYLSAMRMRTIVLKLTTTNYTRSKRFFPLKLATAVPVAVAAVAAAVGAGDRGP